LLLLAFVGSRFLVFELVASEYPVGTKLDDHDQTISPSSWGVRGGWTPAQHRAVGSDGFAMIIPRASSHGTTEIWGASSSQPWVIGLVALTRLRLTSRRRGF